jgi:hypothetical protein
MNEAPPWPSLELERLGADLLWRLQTAAVAQPPGTS